MFGFDDGEGGDGDAGIDEDEFIDAVTEFGGKGEKLGEGGQHGLLGLIREGGFCEYGGALLEVGLKSANLL